jgi:UDP-N-acetylmuramoyl-tripeptide--D-alanyl-D-alanine ligase
MAINSLAVLAAVSLAGADLALAALALAQTVPPPGRGVRVPLEVVGGAAMLIDESYNANPASMAAALGVLGGVSVAGQGRRIAVLGDMLELGATGGALHRGLAAAVTGNAIDLVFCCGPLMRELWDALPSNRRGGYADTAEALESQVVAALHAGDVVMVKGSAGSRMKVIVAALAKRFAAHGARDGATA